VSGYPGLKDFEAKIADEYQDFLQNRSLKFNVAYSEGFESLGIIAGEFIFKHAKPWLRGADDSVATLWKWHLAEEFEHRTVCYDVYKDLYGGYFYRIYGLLYAMKHLGSYGKTVTQFMIEQDYQSGAIKNDYKSKIRKLRHGIVYGSYVLAKVCRIFSPFYNPQKLSMPDGAEEILEAVDYAAS